MANPTGQELVTVQGVYNNQPAATNETFTTAQIAALATNIGATVITSISTAGNGTLTAAGIVGKIISRSGPTSAFTDTTDTAAAIIAALPTGITIGTSDFGFELINTTAFQQTLAAGTNVSFSGLATPLPPNSTANFLVTIPSAASINFSCTRIAYNTAGGYDPNTVQTQFGSSTTGLMFEQGNINRQVFGTQQTPAATGADNVLAVYSLPANSLDTAGRGLMISAAGSFAATTNVKTVKIIFNPSSASVGNTVGGGGTTIGNTGAVTNSAAGWYLQGQVFKYGALGSNTQYGQAIDGNVSTNSTGVGSVSSITANEAASISIAITGNAATATTDILLSIFATNVMN